MFLSRFNQNLDEVTGGGRAGAERRSQAAGGLEEVIVLEGAWGGQRDGSDRPCQGDPACLVLPQQAAQGASSLQQTVCDSETPHSQNLPEYFKKLRLMWKGNHLVLLEYVLNPGLGRR